MLTRLILTALCVTALTAATLSAQSRIVELNETGWKLLQSGEAGRAAKIFAEALEMQPDEPVLQFGAAVASHVQGRTKDATARLERVLDIAPSLTPASILLGQLQYAAGDYNCLHQDLYGEHVFALQLAILLSEPNQDFTGGEFVLSEQRPRMQSRPMVVPLRQGSGVVFAVNYRPVKGSRGSYRVTLRHGVNRIRSGHRYTLGIIFHDAA